ncbi:unnamed protein product [Miscanthus lutarioriparius]|uniref:indole-3-pyruvate monooxygenase n=1 Tax=Miscanthus lutarioriparius TaxID=422564 RepID=A0A811SNP4_9POAL|nr:unnamed protein product [Miscanthus lutarioriparius]
MQGQQDAGGSPKRQESSAAAACLVRGPIIVGGAVRAGRGGDAEPARGALYGAGALRRHRRPVDEPHVRPAPAAPPQVFCELPHARFPADFPTYPTKHDFLRYLRSYAARFDVSPLFGRTVTRARYDADASLWRVTAVSSSTSAAADGGVATTTETETEYVSPWLVVASGENAEVVVPTVKGGERFAGRCCTPARTGAGRGSRA